MDLISKQSPLLCKRPVLPPVARGGRQRDASWLAARHLGFRAPRVLDHGRCRAQAANTATSPAPAAIPDAGGRARACATPPPLGYIRLLHAGRRRHSYCRHRRRCSDGRRGRHRTRRRLCSHGARWQISAAARDTSRTRCRGPCARSRMRACTRAPSVYASTSRRSCCCATARRTASALEERGWPWALLPGCWLAQARPCLTWPWGRSACRGRSLRRVGSGTARGARASAAARASLRSLASCRASSSTVAACSATVAACSTTVAGCCSRRCSTG